MTLLDWVRPQGRRSSAQQFSSTRVPGCGTQYLVALAQKKMVGHAGDVVADHSMARLDLSQIGVLLWHWVRVLHEEKKKRVQRSHGAVAFLCDGGIRVKPGVKKAFQFAVLASYFG